MYFYSHIIFNNLLKLFPSFLCGERQHRRSRVRAGTRNRLKSFRQIFAYCLLNHAGTSKADESAPFGKVDIAKHCRTVLNTACCRVGHNRNEWNARIRKLGVSLPLVLASCINESAPSIIRAPPLDETIINGALDLRAFSMARATFSPTTEPMLPPIKLKSITAINDRRDAVEFSCSCPHCVV